MKEYSRSRVIDVGFTILYHKSRGPWRLPDEVDRPEPDGLVRTDSSPRHGPGFRPSLLQRSGRQRAFHSSSTLGSACLMSLTIVASGSPRQSRRSFTDAA